LFVSLFTKFERFSKHVLKALLLRRFFAGKLQDVTTHGLQFAPHTELPNLTLINWKFWPLTCLMSFLYVSL